VAKRALDLVLATCALIAASPFLVIIAIAIRMTMGGPVIFRQERPGLHGKPFTIFKFRSMANPPADADEFSDPDERVTRLGRWLRRSSLDEVPELVNVIRGEMSLVGPRPLVMLYLPRYTEEQMRRHDVRPGITGLAQVQGRHDVPWEDRFRLDLWYVDHWSLRLDARIILDTFGVLMSGQSAPDPSSDSYSFKGRRGGDD
jgi:lipopolysaccharide/colanic/teichoic acid biosynthesis glycosyltransferase